MSLAVIRSSVGVVTSPGKLIKFPPTEILVRCVSAFCSRILATIIPLLSLLLVGNFSLGLKKIVFVHDGILVPSPCDIQLVSFANKFSQVALVGPLIWCLYSSDALVVGSMTTFAWWFSCIFFASTEMWCAVSLLIPALWYCTRVLLVVGLISPLCSGDGSVDLLVPLSFWCILTLLLLMLELPGLNWEVHVLYTFIPRIDPPLEVGPSDFPPLGV